MIKPVSYATILDDPNAGALLSEYAAECSLPELGNANPQRELYSLLERSGKFQAFGVYEQDKLIGFATVVIHPLPHYEGRFVASTESLFISRESRGAYGWVNLKAHVMRYACERECSAFSFVAPEGSRFDRVLSHDKGVRHTNNVYLVSL